MDLSIAWASSGPKRVVAARTEVGYLAAAGSEGTRAVRSAWYAGE
jgi:hypothetical protein